MNTYKVEFMWVDEDRPVYECDLIRAESAAEAAEIIRQENDYLGKIQVQNVYKDCGDVWYEMEF